jgi:hypothetical protein
MELEEWRDIKGFEGLYQVSNTGLVRSLSRESRKKNRFVKEKLLSVKNQKGWYLTTRIRDNNGIWRTKRIHRLVYETFVGDISKGYTIHHKDFNCQNNRLENLEILSTKEHTKKHREANPNILEGIRTYNKYVRTNPILQYSMDGILLGVFSNAKEASKKTGVCQRDILLVANKVEWKPGKVRKQAGGYIWKIKE